MAGLLDFPITSGFMQPFYLDSGGTNKGLDFGMPVGTPVGAVRGGKVVAAGDSGDGWGTSVKILDAAGRTWNYGHLSGPIVKVGEIVSPGQLIGLSGNTGKSTGPHLSLDVWTTPGNYIDPMPFLTSTEEPAPVTISQQGAGSGPPPATVGGQPVVQQQSGSVSGQAAPVDIPLGVALYDMFVKWMTQAQAGENASSTLSGWMSPGAIGPNGTAGMIPTLANILGQQSNAIGAGSLTGTFNGQPTLASILQTAGLTGLLNGQPTLASQALTAQQQAQQQANAIGVGTLTGTFNGQPTLAATAQQQGNALGVGQLTGTFNGQPTLAAQTLTQAKFEADRQYALDVERFGVTVAQFNYQQRLSEATTKVDTLMKLAQLRGPGDQIAYQYALAGLEAPEPLYANAPHNLFGLLSGINQPYTASPPAASASPAFVPATAPAAPVAAPTAPAPVAATAPAQAGLPGVVGPGGLPNAASVPAAGAPAPPAGPSRADVQAAIDRLARLARADPNNLLGSASGITNLNAGLTGAGQQPVAPSPPAFSNPAFDPSSGLPNYSHSSWGGFRLPGAARGGRFRGEPVMVGEPQPGSSEPNPEVVIPHDPDAGFDVVPLGDIQGGPGEGGQDEEWWYKRGTEDAMEGKRPVFYEDKGTAAQENINPGAAPYWRGYREGQQLRQMGPDRIKITRSAASGVRGKVKGLLDAATPGFAEGGTWGADKGEAGGDPWNRRLFTQPVGEPMNTTAGADPAFATAVMPTTLPMAESGGAVRPEQTAAGAPAGLLSGATGGTATPGSAAAGGTWGGTPYTDISRNIYDPRAIGAQPAIAGLRGSARRPEWSGATKLSNPTYGLLDMPWAPNYGYLMGLAPSQQAAVGESYDRGLGVNFADILENARRASPVGRRFGPSFYQ